MLPDIPHLNRYFDLAEFFLIRLTLFGFLIMGLYRIFRGEKRDETFSDSVTEMRMLKRAAATDGTIPLRYQMGKKTEIEKLEADLRRLDREYENRKLALVTLQMGMSADGRVEDEELITLYEMRKKFQARLDSLKSQKR
jgi:hypothetical protein